MPIDEGDNELARFLASRGAVTAQDTGYNYQYDRPQGVAGSEDWLKQQANLYSGDALRALWAEYLRVNPEIRKTVKEQEFMRGFGLGGVVKKATKKALTAKQAQLVASGLNTEQSNLARALSAYKDEMIAEQQQLANVRAQEDADFAKEQATSGLLSGLFS